MSNIELSWFPDHSNWVKGKVDNNAFCAKLYDNSSTFGINQGRVSKLWIEGIANYDRGWDFGEDQPVVNDLVSFLEQTPKRWSDDR